MKGFVKCSNFSMRCLREVQLILILSSFILVNSLIDALGLFFVIFCESLKLGHFFQWPFSIYL